VKIIFLILLIIPVAFVQLIIFSDIINTSHMLRKAQKIKTSSQNYEYENENKEMLKEAN